MIGTEGWEGAILHVDPFQRALVVQVARRRGDHFLAVRSIGGPALDSEVVPDGGEVPAMAIPEGLARLLHQLLNEHFGGPGPGREARADLLHERGRVDQLLAHLIVMDAGGAR